MVLRKNLRDIGAAGLNSSEPREPRETVLGHHLDPLSVSELSFTFAKCRRCPVYQRWATLFSRYNGHHPGSHGLTPKLNVPHCYLTSAEVK